MAIVRSFVIAALCLVATLAHAFTRQVSDAFPLADTIYGPSAGEGKLRSDGRNGFLFWLDEDRVSVVRIDGEERVSKLVFPFPISSDNDFDAVWTGSHFLVVGMNLGYDLIAQRIDSSGDPVGPSIQLAENGLWPRLAFNGRNALLMYVLGGEGVVTRLLTPWGTPAGAESVLEPALLSSSELHLASNGEGFAAIVPQGAYNPESLFVLDANGQRVAHQTLDNPRAAWSLTSNGSRYFAVSAHSGKSNAQLFERDGTLAARADLQPAGVTQRVYRFPAAAWTGSRWLVALQMESGTRTRLLEVDAAGGVHPVTELTGVSDMQLVSAGGRVVGAWQHQLNGVLAGDVLPAGNPQRALIAARHQHLRATATSSSSTLFVWHELEFGRSALRIGLRTHDGRWRERELAEDFGPAIAASDGNGFVVVTQNVMNGNRIIRLDANGETISTTPFDEFEPIAVASNGEGYALVGWRAQDFVANGNLLAVEIAGSSVSPVRDIPFPANDVVDLDIASDGEDYLVAWGVEGECSPIVVFCGAVRIAGMLLDESATPNGAVLALTAEEHSGDLALAFDGSEYVLARNARGVTASHVSRAGAARDAHILTGEHSSNLSMVPAAGGVVVAWVSDRGVFANALTSSGPDGQPLLIDDDRRHFPWWDGRLASIGNGALAYAFSVEADAAPIHGRIHVMAKVIAPALPPRPSAPVLTVRDFGATIVLQWTGGGQVDGYRVEQRIGDGPWIEIGGWRDAGDRSLTVRTDASPQFRVRGFNEAGAGPYSSGPSRRRAVR
jgi:hypothetical protein